MSQNSRNQGFSHYFCLMMEGSGSVQKKRIRMVQTNTDPTDPDPQNSPLLVLNFEDEPPMSFRLSIFHTVKVKTYGRKYIYWSLLLHCLAALAEHLIPNCPLL
jgi:hypothetical protein